MGFLKNLFGGNRAASESLKVEKPPCLHVTLVPKWDNVADMGSEDKASGFTCDACRQTFTGEEGRALRATEATRLRSLDTPNP